MVVEVEVATPQRSHFIEHLVTLWAPDWAGAGSLCSGEKAFFT
jgi:hypothetical protein